MPSSLLHLRRARRRPHDAAAAAAAAAIAMLRLHQDRPPSAAAAPDQWKAVVPRNVIGGHRPHVPRRVGNQLMEVVLVVRGGGRGRTPRSDKSTRIRVSPTAEKRIRCQFSFVTSNVV